MRKFFSIERIAADEESTKSIVHYRANVSSAGELV